MKNIVHDGLYDFEEFKRIKYMLNLDIDSYSQEPKSSLEPITIAIAILIDFLFVLSFLTVEI